MTGVQTCALPICNENTAFIPLPGYGLEDYINATNISSVAMGPTLQAYGRIFSDLSNLGNERGYYKRDVGPYPWQKKESAKVLGRFASIFGVTGKDVDPLVGLQSQTTAENRIK